MRLRLFWTMLLAFVLVIVLGIGGMITFFGLSLASQSEIAPLIPDSANMRELQRSYGLMLQDYYTARGNSWDGVETRLRVPPLASGFLYYALANADGTVVDSNDPQLATGAHVESRRLANGMAIESRGKRVGTFLLRSQLSPGQGSTGAAPRRPSAASMRFGRAFLSAVLGLLAVLLALAVIFAGWLSRPLRRLNAGAHQLAAGKLDVQVQGAAVREMDDLAQSFNSMARALLLADRQRRQITADTAHELRTPLTIIKGRLEGIQDGVYEATPEQISRLLDETALLERLIEDLRLLALAENGQLPLYLEPIDPHDLLDHAAAAFAEPAHAQGVDLRVVSDDCLPVVNVDPQRMSQVLNNLISNALRYTPAGGAITLGARAVTAPESNVATRPQPAVVLTVADTGQGIAAADLPQIFDRFWRADPSRARTSGGSGLGLAIARQIVVAHGGAIAATSVANQGATISITLPAAGEC